MSQQLTLDDDLEQTHYLSVSTSTARLPAITIAGRTLQPTTVFDTYWRFAARRQEVYELTTTYPFW